MMTPGSPPFDRAFLEASPFAQVVFAPDLRILDVNALQCEMVGLSREQQIGRIPGEVFPDRPGGSDSARIGASIRSAFEHGLADTLPNVRHDVADPDGKWRVRYWSVTHVPVMRDGEAVAVVQTVQDTTDTRLAIDRDASRRRLLEAGAGVAFIDAALESRSLTLSPGARSMLRMGGAGAVSGSAFLRMLDAASRQAFEDALTEAARGVPGQGLELALRVSGADGADLHLRLLGEIRPGYGEGEPRLVGSLIDMTEAHEREAALEHALAQRDALLSEINHRVKNSLQLVLSIIALEGAGATDPAAIRHLLNAELRAFSIAAVHGAMYGDAETSEIDFRAFVERFASDLAARLGAGRKGIEVRVDGGALSLPPDLAVTLSLVTGEWLVNVLTHALADGAEGTVRLWVNTRDGAAFLGISNDVTGCLGGDCRTGPAASTLGGRLVAGSLRKLGATLLDADSDGAGCSQCLTFPLARSAEASGDRGAP